MGGVKFPTAECAAAPTGLLASLESMPTAAWLQIMLTTCMMETGYFLFDYEGYPHVGDKEAGDIGGEAWVRYDDPETKTFKLNARARPAQDAGSRRASTRGVVIFFSCCFGAVQ